MAAQQGIALRKVPDILHSDITLRTSNNSIPTRHLILTLLPLPLHRGFASSSLLPTASVKAFVQSAKCPLRNSIIRLIETPLRPRQPLSLLIPSPIHFRSTCRTKRGETTSPSTSTTANAKSLRRFLGEIPPLPSFQWRTNRSSPCWPIAPRPL
jgi:hypothetical protein